MVEMMAEIDQHSAAHLQRSVLHLLRRVDQCAAQLYMAESSNSDLTLRQFAVLVAISQEPDLSQTDLVSITGIDRSTIAGIVSRLLRKGLLERRRSPDDGRAYCVRLSKRGSKAVAGADRLYSKVEKKLFSGVPMTDVNQLVSTLSTIVATQIEDERKLTLSS